MVEESDVNVILKDMKMKELSEVWTITRNNNMSETSVRTLNSRLQHMFDYVEQFCELGAECDIPLELLLCYPEVPFQFYFGTQTMDWNKYVLEFADLFEIYYLNKHNLMNLDFRQKYEINLLITVTKSVKGGIDYKALQDYIIRKRSKFKIVKTKLILSLLQRLVIMANYLFILKRTPIEDSSQEIFLKYSTYNSIEFFLSSQKNFEFWNDKWMILRNLTVKQKYHQTDDPKLHRIFEYVENDLNISNSTKTLNFELIFLSDGLHQYYNPTLKMMDWFKYVDKFVESFRKYIENKNCWVDLDFRHPYEIDLLRDMFEKNDVPKTIVNAHIQEFKELIRDKRRMFCELLVRLSDHFIRCIGRVMMVNKITPIDDLKSSNIIRKHSCDYSVDLVLKSIEKFDFNRNTKVPNVKQKKVHHLPTSFEDACVLLGCSTEGLNTEVIASIVTYDSSRTDHLPLATLSDLFATKLEDKSVIGLACEKQFINHADNKSMERPFFLLNSVVKARAVLTPLKAKDVCFAGFGIALPEISCISTMFGLGCGPHNVVCVSPEIQDVATGKRKFLDK